MALPTDIQAKVGLDVDALRKRVHNAYAKAFANIELEQGPEEIAKAVTTMLTNERRDMVLKLMGLADRWGKLEVDRANGTKTPLVKKIDDLVVSCLDKWFEENFAKVLFAKAEERLAKPAVMAAITKDFMEHFNYSLNSQVRNYAERAAKTLAKQIHDEMTEKLSFEEK